VHFGLGQESVIREIRILWPGGNAQVIETGKANRYLTVEERVTQRLP